MRQHLHKKPARYEEDLPGACRFIYINIMGPGWHDFYQEVNEKAAYCRQLIPVFIVCVIASFILSI